MTFMTYIYVCFRLMMRSWTSKWQRGGGGGSARLRLAFCLAFFAQPPRPPRRTEEGSETLTCSKVARDILETELLASNIMSRFIQ